MDTIPKDLLRYLFLFLDFRDYLMVLSVCKNLHKYIYFFCSFYFNFIIQLPFRRRKKIEYTHGVVSFSFSLNTFHNLKKIKTLRNTSLDFPLKYKKIIESFDLEFAKDITKPLDFSFFINLKKLHIDLKNNQEIGGLPDTIQEITISSKNYNNPLPKLPKNLLYLYLDCEAFDKDIKNLPSNLETLILDSEIFNKSLDYLPSKLRKLKIWVDNGHDISLDHLPENLESLLVSCYYLNIDHLPLKLKKLILISGRFNKPLGILPKNLKKLYISSKYFNQDLSVLSDHLEFLRIESLDFDWPISDLPKSLKILELVNCSSFDQPLYDIPTNITIIIKDCFRIFKGKSANIKFVDGPASIPWFSESSLKELQIN